MTYLPHPAVLLSRTRSLLPTDTHFTQIQ